MNHKKKKVVLVVDRSKAFRTRITKILSAHGCFVLTANSSETGLEIIVREAPHVVVLESEMPRAKAEEFYGAIVSANSTARLLLSGNSNDGKTAFPCLKKSISGPDLLNHIGGSNAV